MQLLLTKFKAPLTKEAIKKASKFKAIKEVLIDARLKQAREIYATEFDDEAVGFPDPILIIDHPIESSYLSPGRNYVILKLAIYL